MVLSANRNSPVVFDINQLATVSRYQLSIAHQEFNVAYPAGREVDFHGVDYDRNVRYQGADRAKF
jgi:hypothetical protein